MSAFAIESQGDGSFGPVSVSGQHNGAGIVHIQATAFDQEFTLSQAQLDHLRDFMPNGVKLSYSGGFDGISKRVHVHFTKGTIPFTEQATTLILTENGDAWIDTSGNVYYEAD
ncbi:hypothetical protein [Oceanidesulfovibrio marinus]|uniref:Uncharacterized protein n=1 Tax=Oceanidesulfovibrio marinus TaxID=370038 RepID=A0A6P1ZI57_9BACT|nr:hypothetical protein [Oceanidesulfovibrio marinus]TVM35022.1 hypothetical protein DQK91_06365 [Oceanidesulfovibrio marinus]